MTPDQINGANEAKRHQVILEAATRMTPFHFDDRPAARLSGPTATPTGQRIHTGHYASPAAREWSN